MFAGDTMIYMNENDDTKPLENTIKSFCEVFTAKFNEEKSEILPMGTKKYRDEVVRTRITNQANGRTIDPKIKIIGDRESIQTLGAYVGNKNKLGIQWGTVLQAQAKIMKNWSGMNLLTKGKELVLKALIQSRAMYLATANKMPKDIIKRMTT